MGIYTEKTAIVAFAALFALALAAAPALSDTQAYVRPEYLDAVLFGPVSGNIYVETDSPGTYRVSITGVPEDWLSYQKTVHVEKDAVVAYTVNPKATGKYTLFITVKGPGGTFDFENRLWVGPADSSESGDYAGQTPEEVTSSGGLTGMFTLSPQDATIAIYAVTILAAALAVLAGHFMLKKEGA
ncbi:MAG: hypothetical protein V1813_00455 [Candidatus Aenigmatarchaeota archaeon]